MKTIITGLGITFITTVVLFVINYFVLLFTARRMVRNMSDLALHVYRSNLVLEQSLDLPLGIRLRVVNDEIERRKRETND